MKTQKTVQKAFGASGAITAGESLLVVSVRPEYDPAAQAVIQVWMHSAAEIYGAEQ